MSKTKRTLLLAIASVLNLLVSSLGGLVLGRVILSRLGSDYNGLNAIITQFLTVVTLVEGGYTTASLVAMFQPYARKDTGELNQLYGESSHRFRMIGCYALIFGLVFAVVYSFIMQTNIPYLTILAVLCIALVSAVFNLHYVTKVRILFQVSQTEHIYIFITLLTNLLSQCAMIGLLLLSRSIILARCAHLLCTVAAGLAAHAYFFRHEPFVAVDASWDGVKRIHGTRDVLIGKIVSVIHGSSSVLFLSVFANILLTSVYAVYNSVISVVSSVVNIAITSSQNALGLVLGDEDNAHAENVVHELEYLVILILTVLFAALGIVLLPFVAVYTSGITDIEYVDPTLSAVLLLTVYLQLIHIPSGLCINMAGRFAAARKIQMAGLAVLLFGSLVLGPLFGFYGVLSGILLCNLMLAVLEIGYTHGKLFPGSLGVFLRALLPNFLLMAGLVVILQPVAERFIQDYLSFFLCGCCMFLLSFMMVGLLNLLLFRKRMQAVFIRFMGLLHRK